MSDVATVSRLAPAVSQLPVNWYFDDKVFEFEKKLLFAAGPGYVGHQLMVPQAGDYRSLEWQDHGQMLLNGGDAGPDAGIWQMSNVCRHRQSIMLQGSGKLQGNLVCPIHRWTYDTRGQLIGAPHFPQNPCLNLDRAKLENWNGLLFQWPAFGPCRPRRHAGGGRSRFHRLQARPRRDARVQLQLEDLHRGLS